MTSLGEEDRHTPWFDDGNLIIAVEGKHFRVHRGVLSSYSTVFKDMFSCAKPDDPELPTTEDCPVVTLYDSVSDVQTVLLAMYDRRYASPAKPICFSTLSVFLRLGKKYIIRQLFDEARAFLEALVGNQTTDTLTCDSTPNWNLDNIIGKDKFNFRIINLAREIGLLSILPAALFHCALSCPVEYILEGYDDELVGACHLCPENQRACVIGREKLPAIYCRGLIWLRDPSWKETCYDAFNAFECATVCDQMLREVWPGAESPRDLLWDPFTGWDQKWDSQLCDGCEYSCKDSREKARQEAWAELPSIFGVAESWEEVERATFSFDQDEAS